MTGLVDVAPSGDAQNNKEQYRIVYQRAELQQEQYETESDVHSSELPLFLSDERDAEMASGILIAKEVQLGTSEPTDAYELGDSRQDKWVVGARYELGQSSHTLLMRSMHLGGANLSRAQAHLLPGADIVVT